MMNERLTSLGDPSVGRHLLGRIIRTAARIDGVSGRKLSDESAFREKIASYYVAIAGIDQFRSRIRSGLGRGLQPGSEATIGKMTIVKWLQEMTTYAMDVVGQAAAVVDADDEDRAAIQDAFLLVTGYRMGGGHANPGFASLRVLLRHSH